MELFFIHIIQCTFHQIKFQGMFQIYICFSIFNPHNTNRCVCYIINDITTTFLFIQRFEVTVINKNMFFLHLYSSYLNEHKQMYTPLLTFIRILIAPQRPLYIFNTGLSSIKVLTSKEFSIRLIFVYFTLLGGHWL